MLPLPASKILIVEGVETDPLMKARLDRLLTGMPASEVRTVDDEALRDVVVSELSSCPRHGMRRDIEPVVVLNRGRFDDSEAERQRRLEAYPELRRHNLNGYDAFHWRDSGSPGWRQKTSLVCQPAWQIHTIVGCHFRCAYCGLGWSVNILMNMEELVARLDAELERCPAQTLFQYDNGTDTVCFEPEYGGSKLLIDYFARKPGKALELYVGKSGHVDFLLDLDHRGHTVCCWSLSGRTQSVDFEWRSASMDARIEAMRRCQEAGYPVRVRFSPIIPVRGWREENREMIERLFQKVDPDVVTIETIRFLDHAAMMRDFDPDLLDDEFMQVMEDVQGQPCAQGCQVPDAYRKEVYDLIFREIDRVSPHTRIAFCREKRTMWDLFAKPLARHGQDADHYFCNCGPFSHPATAAAQAE